MQIQQRRASTARFTFEDALKDVQVLLNFYDAETKKAPGKPDWKLEVLKRAAIILAITAWETYIEDTVKEVLYKRLTAVNKPDEVGSTFNAVAQTWLSNKPKPPDLAKWALDGWKTMIITCLEDEIDRFNTPKSGKVKHLFTRYLDIDVTQQWKWPGVSPEMACKKLDKLIELRGDLVHRANEVWFNKPRTRVRKRDVESATNLLQRLVDCTDLALGIEPSEKVIEIDD